MASYPPPSALSWARLSHTSAGAVDGVKGLAEIVGERVGGGYDVLAGGVLSTNSRIRWDHS
jgi:hypothetical protein